jgi:hypothetical protein
MTDEEEFTSIRPLLSFSIFSYIPRRRQADKTDKLLVLLFLFPLSLLWHANESNRISWALWSRRLTLTELTFRESV